MLVLTHFLGFVILVWGRSFTLRHFLIIMNLARELDWLQILKRVPYFLFHWPTLMSFSCSCRFSLFCLGGILCWKCVCQKPRESFKCFLEKSWFSVKIVQRFLKLIIKTGPETQSNLISKSMQQSSPFSLILKRFSISVCFVQEWRRRGHPDLMYPWLLNVIFSRCLITGILVSAGVVFSS